MIKEMVPMDSHRVQLSVCWIALMLIYLLGDVLRLYEKGRDAALIDGNPMTQAQLMMAAVLMLVPVLLALGSVFLPRAAARWAGIVAALALFAINIFGVASYSGLFDRVLIVLSLALNVFTAVWAWRW